MSWQSIETAPKDGTEIVLFGTLPGYPQVRACVSHYTRQNVYLRGGDGWPYSVPGYFNEFYPTHWIPLPSPPGDGSQENAGLRAENILLRKALEALYLEQNGPPLIRDAQRWQAAMDAAGELLRAKK